MGKNGRSNPSQSSMKYPFSWFTAIPLLANRKPAVNYLQYCLKNCDWSSNTYSKSDNKHLQSALKKLLADKLLSDKVDSGLLPYNPEFLKQQVMNDEELKKFQQQKMIDQAEMKIKSGAFILRCGTRSKDVFTTHRTTCSLRIVYCPSTKIKESSY